MVARILVQVLGLRAKVVGLLVKVVGLSREVMWRRRRKVGNNGVGMAILCLKMFILIMINTEMNMM